MRSPCGRSKKPAPNARMNLPPGSNSINGSGPRCRMKMWPLELIATPEVLPSVMPAGRVKLSGTAT